MAVTNLIAELFKMYILPLRLIINSSIKQFCFKL